MLSNIYIIRPFNEGKRGQNFSLVFTYYNHELVMRRIPVICCSQGPSVASQINTSSSSLIIGSIHRTIPSASCFPDPAGRNWEHQAFHAACFLFRARPFLLPRNTRILYVRLNSSADIANAVTGKSFPNTFKK